MTIKLTNGLLGLATLLMASQVNATVFAPTDGNINFFNLSLNTNTILAMFDDSDTSFTGDNLLITPFPSDIAITAGGTNPGDFTATNLSLATLNLTSSNQFRLAISTDSGNNWSSDISTSTAGPTSLNITFIDGSSLSVDIAAVPVPAAVWLFGSGLIGLIGIARRKKA